jgi:hypothetical protein
MIVRISRWFYARFGTTSPDAEVCCGNAGALTFLLGGRRVTLRARYLSLSERSEGSGPEYRQLEPHQDMADRTRIGSALLHDHVNGSRRSLLDAE